MKSQLFVLGFLLLLAGTAAAKEAWVTLLYGDEFLLGARVLGRSLRAHMQERRDMVVLVSDGVSDYGERLLNADGWIVERISLLANPNQARPKRFWGVYTKLKIFNMTRYEKVAYLDADTIVVKCIDEIFKCGKFCANLKHSERLNSGVMVVTPSESLFNDMLSKVESLYSYTGGDQGFLNSYFDDFANSQIFDPNLPSEVRNSRPEPETQRLSTLYNADVGLYMLANKWMFDGSELRIIHYTLGPLKPWDWWTAWLVKPVELWQDCRQSLEESLPGTGGGRNPRDKLIVKILFILPFCMLLFAYYKPCLQINRDMLNMKSLCAFARQVRYKYKSEEVLPAYSEVGVASSSFSNSNQKFSNGAHTKSPSYLAAVSVLFCFISAVASLGFAFIIIPRHVLPWTGLLLLYEWTFITFFLIYGSYLRLVYSWGKATANHVGYGSLDSSDNHAGKGYQPKISDCDAAAWFYWLGMAFFAVAALCLPILLSITALFAKLGLMVGGGILLFSFMTYASQQLATMAFVKGQKDRNISRTSMCFLC